MYPHTVGACSAQYHLSYFLKTRSFTESGARTIDQQIPVILLSSPTSPLLGLQVQAQSCPDFYIGSGDLNSGSFMFMQPVVFLALTYNSCLNFVSCYTFPLYLILFLRWNKLFVFLSFINDFEINRSNVYLFSPGQSPTHL